MTSQVADAVVVDGEEFALSGVDGGQLLDPVAYGVKVAPIGTACWRGYIATFALDNESVTLRSLTVSRGTTLDGAVIGVGDRVLTGTARCSDSFIVRQAGIEIAGSSLLLPFTGRLLLGQGLTSGPFRNMGFMPGWRYARVLQVTVKHGAVLSISDRSEEVALVRDGIESGTRPDPDGDAKGTAWIGRTFSLAFARSGLE